MRLCLGLCWQDTAGTTAASRVQRAPGSGDCAMTEGLPLGKEGSKGEVKIICQDSTYVLPAQGETRAETRR